MTTTRVPLGDLRQMRREIVGDVRHQAAGVLFTLLSETQNELQHGPKLSGLFRSSVHPWRGEPDDDAPEPGRPYYRLRTDAAVAAVMRGWRPGQSVGVTSNVPYAQLLAEGWSKQKPAGWVDVAIANAIRKAEATTYERPLPEGGDE